MSCLRKQCLCSSFFFSKEQIREKNFVIVRGGITYSIIFLNPSLRFFFIYSLFIYCIFLAPKACVEIDTVRGAWRDVSCGEYRPFICKRKMGEFEFVTRWRHFTKRMRKTETSSFQCARINLVFHRVRITHDFWVCSDLCWNGVLMVLY